MPDLLGLLQMYSSWHILLLICIVDVMFITVHLTDNNKTFYYAQYGDQVSVSSNEIIDNLLQEQMKLTLSLDHNIKLITNLTKALKTKQNIIEHLSIEMQKIESDISILKAATRQKTVNSS